MPVCELRCSCCGRDLLQFEMIHTGNLVPRVSLLPPPPPLAPGDGKKRDPGDEVDTQAGSDS